jgi:hypothetical protein
MITITRNDINHGRRLVIEIENTGGLTHIKVRWTITRTGGCRLIGSTSLIFSRTLSNNSGYQNEHCRNGLETGGPVAIASGTFSFDAQHLVPGVYMFQVEGFGKTKIAIRTLKQCTNILNRIL